MVGAVALKLQCSTAQLTALVFINNITSGKYFHNVKIGSVEVDLSVVNTTKSGGGCGAQNNGCMCVDDKKVNAATFAVDLARVGYKVGMFGKYLNSWSGKIQPGFSRWFANGGGAYFNTTFNDVRSMVFLKNSISLRLHL